MVELSSHEIQVLKGITTPTISNAIEAFNLRPRNEGYMSKDIHCIFPDLGITVGYAVTGTIDSCSPYEEQDHSAFFDLFERLADVPAPRVLVIQDLSAKPGHAAFTGEIVATILTRLQTVAVVTNNVVRDLDEMHAVGLQCFAAGVVASHGSLKVTSIMQPVEVGGLRIKPGDLLHGDKHGVLVIPDEAARGLTKAVDEVLQREARILAAINSPDFGFGKVRKAFDA